MPEDFAAWLAARPGLAGLADVDEVEHEQMPGFLYTMAAMLKIGRPLTVRQVPPAVDAWARWRETRVAYLPHPD